MTTRKESVSGTGADTEMFGWSAAKHYDKDARAMGWRYDAVHRIQNECVIAILASSETSSPTLLELGCGSGTDAVAILSASSNGTYVGVDLSEAMLKVAAGNLLRARLSERAVLLPKDFRRLTIGDLCVLNRTTTTIHVTCILSSLALHHYSSDDKVALYSFAYRQLDVDGCLVLTDLYLNSVLCCFEHALLMELADVRAAAEIIGTRNYPTTIDPNHYQFENTPLGLSQEVSLLVAAGFGPVDLLFRVGQLGIIVAKKSVALI